MSRKWGKFPAQIFINNQEGIPCQKDSILQILFQYDLNIRVQISRMGRLLGSKKCILKFILS
eukprot:403332989